MTYVKICGITNLEDALLSDSSGADALGFNFYRQSPRFIEPFTAAAIIEQLSEKVVKVGVFVNESIEGILDTASACRIDAIQLHGNEGPEFVSELRGRTKAMIIKAVRIASASDLLQFNGLNSDAVLVDVYDPHMYGGTGKIADWDAAAELRQLVERLYLAGGLGPDNVADAIRKVRPYAVDAASGLESEKGKKDPDKVVAFITNARNA